MSKDKQGFDWLLMGPLYAVYLYNSVKFLMTFIERGVVNFIVSIVISVLLLRIAFKFFEELEDWMVIGFLSLLFWVVNLVLVPNFSF
jgi:hypothetical protein